MTVLMGSSLETSGRQPLSLPHLVVVLDMYSHHQPDNDNHNALAQRTLKAMTRSLSCETL